MNSSTTRKPAAMIPAPMTKLCRYPNHSEASPPNSGPSEIPMKFDEERSPSA
jgi:hypothetical protein